jgi:hypothetical protein
VVRSAWFMQDGTFLVDREPARPEGAPVRGRLLDVPESANPFLLEARGVENPEDLLEAAAARDRDVEAAEEATEQDAQLYRFLSRVCGHAGLNADTVLRQPIESAGRADAFGVVGAPLVNGSFSVPSPIQTAVEKTLVQLGARFGRTVKIHHVLASDFAAQTLVAEAVGTFIQARSSTTRLSGQNQAQQVAAWRMYRSAASNMRHLRFDGQRLTVEHTESLARRRLRRLVNEFLCWAVWVRDLMVWENKE